MTNFNESSALGEAIEIVRAMGEVSQSRNRGIVPQQNPLSRDYDPNYIPPEDAPESDGITPEQNPLSRDYRGPQDLG